MRKLHFAGIIAGVLLTALVYSQIPNAGFESWTYQSLFEHPNAYLTTALQTYFNGVSPNVTKVDGASGYGVRLETVDAEQGPIFGGLFLGMPGPGGLQGGTPFSSTPDSFALRLRYDIQPGDNATIVLFFKKAGVPIFFPTWTVSGNLEDFTRFSFPLNSFPFAPDSLAMAIFSGNLSQVGSWIEIDEMEMINSADQLPNSSFEFWTDEGSQEADAWWSTNAFNLFFGESPKVTPSFDCHSGTHAVRIETFRVDLGGGDNTYGYVLLNAHIGDGGPVGGVPYTLSTLNPEISGFYKYAPVGSDSALVYAQFSKYNTSTHETDSVGTFFFFLPLAPTYTPFAFQPALSILPDTVLIGFAASDVRPGAPHAQTGSVLYVDDVKVSDPVAVIELMPEEAFRVYPNPSAGEVWLDFGDQEVLSVQVYDLNGRLVAGVQAPQSPLRLNLPAGCFVVRMTGNSGVVAKRVVVE